MSVVSYHAGRMSLTFVYCWLSISDFNYQLFIISGRSVRCPAGDPERGDVRPERVGHASDGARARVVRRHRAHGVRRQRRHLLRHSAHAHARPRP